MNDIIFNQVFKTYNPGLFKKKSLAVSGLNLRVGKGEVFGLIGPNGAGKSTTIRLLLGLIRPDSGSILLRETPLRESYIQRDIGYLPENPYLYDHLTLEELLTFCGRTSGLRCAEITERGHALMDKLNLLTVQKRPLRTFSKGMLQRAGICFALLHDPPIVVLDEPMSGLDPVGRKMVFDLVQELKQQDKTIFFCSHILNDVERLCDRIGLMNKGCLVREFARQDFMQHCDETVFLKTAQLSFEQQQQVEAMGVTVRVEAEGHLLAVAPSIYYELNRYLEQSDINILGCRAEWISLESLFIQSVQES